MIELERVSKIFESEDGDAVVALSEVFVVMSPRPGRIIDVVPVRLTRPRSFAQESLPEFQSCAQRIRGHILDRSVV